MDPVLRALLAASCKARWCVLRGGGSEAGAAEDGDDLMNTEISRIFSASSA